MTHHSQRAYGIRASDLEREKYAHRIEAANGEGRLTLAEADRRLALVYDATYRHELEWLVSDLPEETASSEDEGAPESDSAERSAEAKIRLGVHVAIVAVLAVFLVALWSASDAPFFWPAVPLFWLTLSVLGHVWVRHHEGAFPMAYFGRMQYTTGR